jgi:hypothetical protein
LETKLEELREEVRLLRASRKHGNRKSKAQLRKEYCLSKDDVHFLDDVMTFTAEYLFPRCKFLNKGWTKHDPTMKKGFSMLVKQHMPIRSGMTFAEEWDLINAPAIAKKYTDMRCNMNNLIRKTFVCKCTAMNCSFFYTTTVPLTYCCFVRVQVDNNKMEMNPDDLAKGVVFWKMEMRMDELVSF